MQCATCALYLLSMHTLICLANNIYCYAAHSITDTVIAAVAVASVAVFNVLCMCYVCVIVAISQVKGKEERIWPFAVVPSRAHTPTSSSSKDKRSSSRSSASNAHSSSSGAGGASHSSAHSNSSSSKAKAPLPGMIGRKKLCEQVLHCVTPRLLL
jgi:hypothetical protein